MHTKFLRFTTVFAFGFAAFSSTATAFADDEVPHVDTASGQKRAGFALQANISTSQTIIDASPVLIGLGNFTGGLTLGYKIDRVMIGVGFDFTNLGSTSTIQDFDPNTGQPLPAQEVTRNTYSFIVYPEVQFAIAQSADRRAELIGDVSIGLGTWGTRRSTDTTPSTNPNTDIRLRWRIAPGLRYWVHPQISVNVLAGITGDNMITIGDTAANDSSSGITSLYGQMGLLGVF